MELKLSAAAESDLAEARDWYDVQRPGLGDEFLLSVRSRLEVMAERPLQFPLLESESGRHFRFALIRRFPYRIVFEVRPADTVVVLAVAHTSRHPQAWRGRLT